MHRLSRAASAAVATAFLLSCGGGESTAPRPVLTTLTVSFPNPTITVGQSANASASALDQFGTAIATGTVTWTTGSSAIASVSASGVVTGVAVGQTEVIANAGGKEARAPVNVIPVPVVIVTVTPTTATVGVGGTQQLTATTLDGNSNVLTGRVVAWTSSDPSRATVNGTGLVTGVAAGVVNISATSEGKTGMAQITVSGVVVNCTGANTLQLGLGDIHPLTAAEKAALCLGGGASASEYVLIPFNSTNVAASTLPIEVAATNTSPIQGGQLANLQPVRSLSIGSKQATQSDAMELAFRQRERRDLQSVFGARRRQTSGVSSALSPRFLTGIPANPTVGSVVDINANLSGNSCSDPKQLHGAVVVAVLQHTIVLSDTLSPTGGYTNAELTSFGQAFDTLGYDLDVANFGAPTDIDSNGRLAILFTPGVNRIPGPPGGYVGGLFAGRDLVPVTTCLGSNEGEMFYLPVPDPNQTINSNYKDKATLARGNLGTLVHEFQHLINAGRRMYVNNASSFEEVWLNEGLSHIAEELLYYRFSGNAPRSNIDLTVFLSSQAQLDAANAYMLGNMGRLSSYMHAPETNSSFAQTDGLAMRGAIWQLLRYSMDRKGGPEPATWFALVNSTTAGQANFNAAFGDIISLSRDWAVAQFLDDAGIPEPSNYTHPSWNYRSLLPPINGGNFPLLTHDLSVPANMTLNGGGAAYLRFGVAANTTAAIAATSSGQTVPAAVDFILVRTQ